MVGVNFALRLFFPYSRRVYFYNQGFLIVSVLLVNAKGVRGICILRLNVHGVKLYITEGESERLPEFKCIRVRDANQYRQFKNCKAIGNRHSSSPSRDSSRFNQNVWIVAILREGKNL